MYSPISHCEWVGQRTDCSISTNRTCTVSCSPSQTPPRLRLSRDRILKLWIHVRQTLAVTQPTKAHSLAAMQLRRCGSTFQRRRSFPRGEGSGFTWPPQKRCASFISKSPLCSSLVPRRRTLAGWACAWERGQLCSCVMSHVMYARKVITWIHLLVRI